MTAFPPCPTDDEAMGIAQRVYEWAERIASGDKDQALQDMATWFDEPDVVAELRIHYMAAVGPVLASALLQKHFPVYREADELWVMQKVPGAPAGDVHDECLTQVVVRYLNDDTDTARALTEAHLEVHGVEGLFSLGCESVELMAGLIEYGRQQAGASWLSGAVAGSPLVG